MPKITMCGVEMERLRYVGGRIVQALPTVIFIACLNFLLLHLTPGDVVSVLAGESGGATPEYLAELRSRFGLDRPLYIQLFLYIKNLFALDLGYSFRHAMPVFELIMQRMVPTLLLMLTTLAVSIGFGVMLGLIAAVKRGTWLDNIISLCALISYATPLFWIGLMLILVFSLKLGWFPTSGMEQVAAFHEGWNRVWDIARHLVLPTVTLSMFYLAVYVRLMRSALLEQTTLDYVTTARAKGLDENAIVLRHMLRNAALPVVTMAGVQVGGLLGGSVVVEAVFAWPGLGSLALASLLSRDYNLLLGIFFVSACLVIAVNILIDLVYTMLDPRIDFAK